MVHRLSSVRLEQDTLYVPCSRGRISSRVCGHSIITSLSCDWDELGQFIASQHTDSLVRSDVARLCPYDSRLSSNSNWRMIHRGGATPVLTPRESHLVTP